MYGTSFQQLMMYGTMNRNPLALVTFAFNRFPIAGRQSALIVFMAICCYMLSYAKLFIAIYCLSIRCVLNRAGSQERSCYVYCSNRYLLLLTPFSYGSMLISVLRYGV
jgi:ABC-type maltose transport system permease subunit